MRKNGLVVLYLLFVKDMVYPERRTISGIIDRYKQKGIEGLSDTSRRPHNIKYKKITSEIQETILDLRLTKRFGCKQDQV
jgi:hypothetical protein